LDPKTVNSLNFTSKRNLCATSFRDSPEPTNQRDCRIKERISSASLNQDLTDSSHSLEPRGGGSSNKLAPSISDGHGRISYFEQPNLTLPTKKGEQLNIKQLFAQSDLWLPGGDTQRTETEKTLTEQIPCYFRYKNKKRILCKGEKPDFVPANKIPTEKDFLSHLSKTEKKNPIMEGFKYINFQENYPNSTYRDIAKEFNITKARVSQMIALVKRLSQEIIDHFINNLRV